MQKHRFFIIIYILLVLFVQLTFSAKALDQTYGRFKYGKERGVSYLPLSHIAAQVHVITTTLTMISERRMKGRKGGGVGVT